MEQKAMELIEKLAQKLGVASEYVWATLVRQKFAEGIFYLAIDACLLILAVVGVKLVLKYGKAMANDNFKDGCVFGWIGLILMIGSVIIFAGTIHTGIMQTVTPDYYAIQDIFALIK